MFYGITSSSKTGEILRGAINEKALFLKHIIKTIVTRGNSPEPELGAPVWCLPAAVPPDAQLQLAGAADHHLRWPLQHH